MKMARSWRVTTATTAVYFVAWRLKVLCTVRYSKHPAMGSACFQGLHQWLAGPVLRRAARTRWQSKERESGVGVCGQAFRDGSTPPFFHACGRNDDVQAIKDICSLPGLRLSSDTMKDNVGRSVRKCRCIPQGKAPGLKFPKRGCPCTSPSRADPGQP